MTGSYWDTSALLKLYATEPDSAYFHGLVAAADAQILTSELTAVELYCALCRKEYNRELQLGATQHLFGDFAQDMERARIVTVTYGADIQGETIRIVGLAFRQTPPVPVRSLDAIHLASAISAKARVFVTTDRRLGALAALAGLQLVP